MKNKQTMDRNERILYTQKNKNKKNKKNIEKNKDKK